MKEKGIEFSLGLIVRGAEEDILRFKNELPMLLESCNCRLIFQRTSASALYVTYYPPFKRDYNER